MIGPVNVSSTSSDSVASSSCEEEISMGYMMDGTVILKYTLMSVFYIILVLGKCFQTAEKSTHTSRRPCLLHKNHHCPQFPEL